MSIVQSGLLLTLCTPFAVAIWIAVVHRRRIALSEGTASFRAAHPVGEFNTASIDLESAVLDAAAAIESLARAHWVRFDVAVKPAMSVQADPNVLGTALRETMTTAIRATPGGQVLVTATTLGSQLHIRIADDGRGDDQWIRESLVRDAGALIALQGGSVVVRATPGRGTTVTMRLPSLGNETEETRGLEEFADQAA